MFFVIVLITEPGDDINGNHGQGVSQQQQINRGGGVAKQIRPRMSGLSRSVTEDEIRQAMSQAIVKQVLSMGIDHSRVKMAIKKRLEHCGNPFVTTESLINAAFSVQRDQERGTHHENLNPSGAMSSNNNNETLMKPRTRTIPQNSTDNSQHNNVPPPLKMPPPEGIPMRPDTPCPSPVTQTPIPPPGHPQFDLPPELLEQGWEKYWSSREKRPYFFNKVNGERRWEMPDFIRAKSKPKPGFKFAGFRSSQTNLSGLKNLGNTCYMNSILQCVSNTPPLAHYFVSRSYEEHLNDHYSKTRGQVASQFAEVRYVFPLSFLLCCVLGAEASMVLTVRVIQSLRSQVNCWGIQPNICWE